jgi:hypothetical protein
VFSWRVAVEDGFNNDMKEVHTCTAPCVNVCTSFMSLLKPSSTATRQLSVFLLTPILVASVACHDAGTGGAHAASTPSASTGVR